MRVQPQFNESSTPLQNENIKGISREYQGNINGISREEWIIVENSGDYWGIVDIHPNEWIFIPKVGISPGKVENLREKWKCLSQ